MKITTTYLRQVIKEELSRVLAEGRYEMETTQISRDIVNLIKKALSKGLPQGKVFPLDPEYPYHYIDTYELKIPSGAIKDGLDLLIATIKVDPRPDSELVEFGGASGKLRDGREVMQIEVDLRKDFTLKNINELIPRLKETIIHELEHLGQPEDFKSASGEPDWNKMSDIRGYFSSQHELEAFAKGAFKKAKVKKISYTDALDETLSGYMKSFIERYKNHKERGNENKLEYNEQDLKNYFEKELPNQILSIARKKYPRAHGTTPKN